MADVAVANVFKTFEYRLDPDKHECPPPGYDAVLGEVRGNKLCNCLRIVEFFSEFSFLLRFLILSCHVFDGGGRGLPCTWYLLSTLRCLLAAEQRYGIVACGRPTRPINCRCGHFRGQLALAPVILLVAVFLLYSRKMRFGWKAA